MKSVNRLCSVFTLVWLASGGLGRPGKAAEDAQRAQGGLKWARGSAREAQGWPGSWYQSCPRPGMAIHVAIAFAMLFTIVHHYAPLFTNIIHHCSQLLFTSTDNYSPLFTKTPEIRKTAV